MTQQKRKKKAEDLDIDFGMGRLSMGGLFQGIEKLVDLAAEINEAGGEIRKEGEFDLSHLKQGMKGVFGFSIKTAQGGKPIVESFGNIKKTPQGPKVEDVREPLTDMFDEKERIVIYAEMPGVKAEDITLDLKGDILDISAQSGDRSYHKELLLSAAVQPKTLSSSFKNGVLEVNLKKVG